MCLPPWNSCKAREPNASPPRTSRGKPPRPNEGNSQLIKRVSLKLNDARLCIQSIIVQSVMPGLCLEFLEEGGLQRVLDSSNLNGQSGKEERFVKPLAMYLRTLPPQLIAYETSPRTPHLPRGRPALVRTHM